MKCVALHAHHLLRSRPLEMSLVTRRDFLRGGGDDEYAGGGLDIGVSLFEVEGSAAESEIESEATPSLRVSGEEVGFDAKG